jgi:hypothetical protein
MWPQPVNGRWTDKVKDQLESSVCRQVCRGAITLQDGQAIFLRPDWTREYNASSPVPPSASTVNTTRFRRLSRVLSRMNSYVDGTEGSILNPCALR